MVEKGAAFQTAPVENVRLIFRQLDPSGISLRVRRDIEDRKPWKQCWRIDITVSYAAFSLQRKMVARTCNQRITVNDFTYNCIQNIFAYDTHRITHFEQPGDSDTVFFVRQIIAGLIAWNFRDTRIAAS